MRKVLVIFIVGVVFFGGCFVQNVNAQNANNSQKIIGTWVSIDGKITWVFNSNGTAKILDLYGDRTVKFVIIDTMLAFEMSGEYALGGYAQVYNIAISSDGKTLILGGGRDGTGFWFTKK